MAKPETFEDAVEQLDVTAYRQFKATTNAIWRRIGHPDGGHVFVLGLLLVLMQPEFLMKGRGRGRPAKTRLSHKLAADEADRFHNFVAAMGYYTTDKDFLRMVRKFGSKGSNGEWYDEHFSSMATDESLLKKISNGRPPWRKGRKKSTLINSGLTLWPY